MGLRRFSSDALFWNSLSLDIFSELYSITLISSEYIPYLPDEQNYGISHISVRITIQMYRTSSIYQRGYTIQI